MSLQLLDCSSCALFNAFQQSKTKVALAAVDRFALDLITGAILVGGAKEALVPFSLLQHLHDSLVAVSGESHRRSVLDRLAKDNRLVVLATPHEVSLLLERFPQYKKLCICVPGGPLASRMLFGQKHLEAFYAEELNPSITALSLAEGYTWTSWLRSSLTCRYEGLYVPAVRVAESVARLLSSDTGCERVVLEEGVPGLSLRWLETVMKTISSCGVPLGRVSVAFCRNEGKDSELISRAVNIGLSGLAVSTVPAPLFPHTGALLGIDDVATLVSGWNDLCGRISAEELAIVDDCVEYCEAVRTMWQSRLRFFDKEIGFATPVDAAS